jgi:hypothetical protein
MSSRLRQAYVAASCGTSKGLTTRARHSEATAACSSAFPRSLSRLVGRGSSVWTQLVASATDRIPIEHAVRTVRLPSRDPAHPTARQPH